jgi:hypothetical protein
MDPRSVKIFSVHDAPRLRYIAGIILGDILGLHWDIVDDKRRLGKHPVINYSDEKISGSFRIDPHGLLLEEGIAPKEINVSEWKGLPVFFQTNSGSDLPFDIFAASFFLISRYEEYLGHDRDQHGRFKAESSVAFRNGFLKKPVIDLWAREFARVLLRKFQTLTFRRNEFRPIVTFDIDEPFAYLGKNLLSSLGGFFRDMASGDGHSGERYRIVVKGEKDPFEVFDYISGSIERFRTETRFFFPVGDHSRFDKYPSWKNEDYRKLIHRIAGKYPVGLHPSYHASGNESLTVTELNRLRNVLGSEISMSRFHLVRLQMPGSYRGIMSAGLREDYSMGYPEECGFRAGIARPFSYYDLPGDKPTDLKVVPFQVMDTALISTGKADKNAPKEMIRDLLDETRKAGGTFVSIWHNTTLLDTPDSQIWREVFEFLLKNQLQ